MKVIKRLTCFNFILLTRKTLDWQTYGDDSADDTVCLCSVNFCVSYFSVCVYVSIGILDLIVCVCSKRSHDVETYMSAPLSLPQVITEIYRHLSLCHMMWIDQSRTSIHPHNLTSYNRLVEYALYTDTACKAAVWQIGLGYNDGDSVHKHKGHQLFLDKFQNACSGNSC